VSTTTFAPPVVAAPPVSEPSATLPAPEFVAPTPVEPVAAAPVAAEPAPWGDETSPAPFSTESFATESFATAPFATESFSTESFATESFVAEPLVAESFVAEPLVDDLTTSTPSPMWDDTDLDLAASSGTDEDRSEIEELIARAEAEAAGQGGSMPLTFSPPEGVDLRAIVAAQPVEPPRPVLDVTGSTPEGSGPDWLSDLVESIEEPSEADTAPVARPVHSATFVTADSNITVRPERTRFNGFALLSLVSALVWVCGLGSVVAVIFAVLALIQIGAVHQRGRLIALAGLVLGVVGIAAAATLFVFDGGSDSATPLSTPVAFGEVIVTSCALDAAGNGVAIVRVVNLNGESVTYDITVAFQTGDQRGVARAETDVLGPDASEMVTVVSETEFTQAPVCTLQDTVRYAAD
jgi:hypothetical protein